MYIPIFKCTLLQNNEINWPHYLLFVGWDPVPESLPTVSEGLFTMHREFPSGPT